ncbi:MAG: 4-(cytidine 5'-diphospho)-2-C-methyl-D-erythritol kinase [Candidatus Bipolaricaulia bacterium]
MKIRAKAFAKVNPRLKVVGKLSDGYHELDISFLSINLADRMIFQPTTREEIEVSTEADISREENLCYRVARKLQQTCSISRGATITLEKEIPIGGGLGGGSSNAATTLICLNRLWNCELSRKALIKIGKEFGADVPFFFYGGYCKGRGKGFDLEKRENVFIDRLVPVIFPPFSQLTSEVYSRFDKLENGIDNQPLRKDYSISLRGEVNNFTVENDLQKAAIDLNPELEDYLNILEEASTIESAGVAGSGSSIFGISRKDATSREIKKELEGGLSSISEEAKLTVTRPTNHGQLIKGGGLA